MDKTQKLITLKIVNNTGDETFKLTVEACANRMVEEAQKFGKWLYIGDTLDAYPMETFTPADVAALSAALDGVEEATIHAGLIGGAAAVTLLGTITKKPISSFLNSRNRAQVAISFSRKDGQNKIKLIGSNYNGALRKLRPYRNVIVAGLVRVLASK